MYSTSLSNVVTIVVGAHLDSPHYNNSDLLQQQWFVAQTINFFCPRLLQKKYICPQGRRPSTVSLYIQQQNKSFVALNIFLQQNRFVVKECPTCLRNCFATNSSVALPLNVFDSKTILLLINKINNFTIK